MTTRRQPPSYFAAVRAEVVDYWDDLERKPVLAAPWWQLFRQVKSPYHVLSEVLQNADDAQATWARAWVEDGAFYFEHNGDDFERDHLESLCRFGFSNKRRLHTIGFRGLGFKSLFSYGPRVELTTPTLAVAFDEVRFTEPVWLEDVPPIEHTRIRVALADERIAQRAEEDIERWANNPVPLLFFRSIRQLELGGRVVSRTDGEPGPAPRSAWVDLAGADTERVLLVHSAEAEVPSDALEEIRQERGDSNFQLPGVTVDVVIGLPDPDRAYVVLPTNVELPVPFSCNAPFIQDPARSGIKDPANSPLNRWLLGRIGALAAETLVAWVGNETLPLDERADAYDHLLPDARPTGGSAGALAARKITAAMELVLADAAVVLAPDGTLVDGAAGLDLPSAIAGVWSAAEALQTFGAGHTALVAAELTARHRERLATWTGLKRLTTEDVTTRLRTAAAVPRPELEKLPVLWAYLEPTIRSNQWYDWIRELRIVPARGSTQLQRATDVTNFGSGGSALEDADWEFLRSLVRSLDPDWVTRLQDARAAGSEADHEMRAAVGVLQYLKLDQTASLGQLIARAAAAMGASPAPGVGVRLAHVAARADAQVDGQFRYRTEDGAWRAADQGVVQRGGAFEDLFPEAWKATHALHASYEEGMSPDMLRTWRSWVAGPKSRVRGLPLPATSKRTLYGKDWAKSECVSRGSAATLGFSLVTSSIELDDYNFPDSFWSHWTALAKQDGLVWTRLVQAIGAEWDPAMEQTATASFHQSSSRYRYKVTGSDMPAAWLHRLRGLPCIPDEHGVPAMPDALLRHTPDTAFMHGAAQFVHPTLDRHEMQPLLQRLGVRSHALSADTLIVRLRALAGAPEPLTHAVLPLYNALDQLVARLPAPETQGLRVIFAKEALALGEDLTWHRTSTIYQRNEERLPGVATMWAPCADLALWQRLGVAARPSIEQLIAWLSTLPSGERLDDGQRRRVRELLAALPRQVWESCRAWLDLSGHWMSASSLRWRAARLASAEGLFTKFRRATADLSMVADDAVQAEVFADLVPLELALARRAVPDAVRQSPRPAWLEALTVGVVRATTGVASAATEEKPIGHPDEATAQRLAASVWRVTDQLAVTPFIGAEQAGAARSVRAAWADDALYVCGSSAQFHRAFVDEIGGAFTDTRLRNAVADCVGRDAEWVRDYFLLELGIDLRSAAPETGTPTGNGDSSAPETSHALAESTSPLGSLLAGPLQSASGAADEHPGGDAARADGAPVQPARSTTASVGASPSLVQRGASVTSHSRSAPRWRTAISAILSALGFSEVSDTAWAHADGRRAEVGGELLHAVVVDAAGGVVARYWVGEGALDDGVLVPAAVWNVFARSPSDSWVVLPDEQRALHGFTVAELRNRIEVAAASYVVRLSIP